MQWLALQGMLIWRSMTAFPLHPHPHLAACPLHPFPLQTAVQLALHALLMAMTTLKPTAALATKGNNLS